MIPAEELTSMALVTFLTGNWSMDLVNITFRINDCTIDSPVFGKFMKDQVEIMGERDTEHKSYTIQFIDRSKIHLSNWTKL